VLTELGRSQAEVQRCSLSSEGPKVRSSGAHSYRTPAVEVQQCPLHVERSEKLARRTAIEVQQCPLHGEVGEKLARWKWAWKEEKLEEREEEEEEKEVEEEMKEETNSDKI